MNRQSWNDLLNATYKWRPADFDAVRAAIALPDSVAAAAARARWDAVAKPLGSLGAFEDAVVQMAALAGSPEVSCRPACAVVFCADNGVVAEGVSQSTHEVTTAVARNLAAGTSSVCAMAAPVGVDVCAVDIGMRDDTPAGVLDRKVTRGTGNITCEPAMTHEQALCALQAGIDLAGVLTRAGYRLICAGEMGIGNTTTAAALAAALLRLPVHDAVGRGAGLTSAGLARKRDAVKRALALHPSHEPLDALANLGGFDIAGMAGLFIGGAVHRVPVVVDGLISAVAAYVAALLVPMCTQAMLASHVSAEPAAPAILARLGLAPVLHAGLRLGEASGAVCLVPLLDMALALYGGTTFEQTGIEPYRELS